MKLSEMRSYVYGFLQANSTKGHWSPEEVNRYIHDGHMKMFEHVAEQMDRFCWTQGTVNEVSGSNEYILPTDCYRVLSIERLKTASGASLTTPIFLEKIDYTPGNIDYWRTTGGQFRRWGLQEAYYQMGQRSFYLVEASTTTQSGAFQVTYIFRPAKMSSDSDYPFRLSADLAKDPDTATNKVDDIREYHDIMCLYALEMCLLKEQSPVAMAIQAKRREREMELDRFLDRSNVQVPKMMNYTRWDEEF